MVLGDGEGLARRGRVAVSGGDVAAVGAARVDDEQVTALVADVLVPVAEEQPGEGPGLDRIVGDRLVAGGVEPVALGEREGAVFGMNRRREHDPTAIR
jgi:hypothetical protein